MAPDLMSWYELLGRGSNAYTLDERQTLSTQGIAAPTASTYGAKQARRTRPRDQQVALIAATVSVAACAGGGGLSSYGCGLPIDLRRPS